MVCLNIFKIFKGCLPKILLGSFLNTLSYLFKNYIFLMQRQTKNSTFGILHKFFKTFFLKSSQWKLFM